MTWVMDVAKGRYVLASATLLVPCRDKGVSNALYLFLMVVLKDAWVRYKSIIPKLCTCTKL